MHKKIEQKAAKRLEIDERKYKEKAMHSHGIKKKHAKIEEKEAGSAARSLKKFAKKAHEF